jgi:integrase
MAVLKIHTRCPKTGKKIKSSKWYVQFRDHLYIVRRLPAFRNKALSLSLERKINELVEYRRAGEALTGDVKRFVDTLDVAILRRLQRWGLVGAQVSGRGVSVDELVMQYLKDLENIGRRESYINSVDARLNKFLEDAQVRSLYDLTPARFIEFRNNLICSAATKNHYLTEIKGFLSWLVKQGNLKDNPLASISPLTASHIEYGILSPDVFIQLIQGTQGLATIHYDTTGKQRALLYLLAGNTGLRISELLAIRWGWIDYNNRVVHLPASATKNKRAAHQPIPQAVIEALRVIPNQEPDKPVFDFPVGFGSKSARVLRKDLQACGLPLVDEHNRKIVFHSLRASFISFLANSDTPAKVVQQLARHSSINLTMNTYAKAYNQSLQSAMDNLPDMN